MHPEITNMVRMAGFFVISLERAYDGWDRSPLNLAPWDNHPNAKAHELLAQQLFNKLKEHPELLGHFSGKKD